MWSNPGHNRQTYWVLAGGWLTLIYSTLYLVRPVCEFLKGALPLSLAINIVLVLAVAELIILVWIRGRGPKRRSCFVLCFLVAAYAYGMASIAYPEERLHFIEYGLLSYLVYNALRFDYPRPVAYLYAFVTVTLCGWADEGIQHLLPNRYYQIDDVFLNSLSGILGLLWAYLIETEHADRRA